MTWQIKLLFLIVIGFNLINCISVPIHPDEAYYWVWSHNLDLSYFDHPPLIAYLIKLTTLFSDYILFVRLGAIICMTLTAVLIYKLAKQLFNVSVAEKALILFFCMPATLVAYWVTTPDAPLLLFWMLTLYFFYRAIDNNHPQYFYVAGLTAGLMLLAKYTGVLLLPALFLFLLLSPSYRKQLLNKHLYFAFGLTILMFMPVVIWNSQHEWASFKFQLMHGMGETKVFNSQSLLEFIGGQAGIFNPIFFITVIFYSCKKIKLILREPKLLYLFIPFAFTLLFFTYAACFKKSEANWPMAAYLSGVILLAYWWDKFNKQWLYITGVAFSLVLMTLVKFPEWFPFLPNNLVLKKQFLGYDKIFAQGNRYIDKDTLILSDSHQDAAETQYYLTGRPAVYMLEPRGFSDYTNWQNHLKDKPIKKVILFNDHDHEYNSGVFQALCVDKIKLLAVLRYQSPYVTRVFDVYQCGTFKPLQSLLHSHS